MQIAIRLNLLFLIVVFATGCDTPIYTPLNPDFGQLAQCTNGTYIDRRTGKTVAASVAENRVSPYNLPYRRPNGFQKFFGEGLEYDRANALYLYKMKMARIAVRPTAEAETGHLMTDFELDAYIRAKRLDLVVAPTQGVQDPVLLLFGGHGHDVFLGCINCSKLESESIWNKYGNFGSRYATDSIWNPYGTFGSIYSDESPWNRNALTPPIIVDARGNFYGYFTVNQSFLKRTKHQFALSILDHYKEIQSDFDAFIDSLK